MKSNISEPERPNDIEQALHRNTHARIRSDGVIAVSERGSIFEMQTGLFHLGRNRAVHSGTTEPNQMNQCT